MKRTPIKRKRSKPRRGRLLDPDFLNWIRAQPCCVCQIWAKDFPPVFPDANQVTPTEAAHVGLRGIWQKCSDREVIPLCEGHHTSGKYAHHRLGKKFWKHHDIDKAALIADLNQRYEAETSVKLVYD